MSLGGLLHDPAIERHIVGESGNLDYSSDDSNASLTIVPSSTSRVASPEQHRLEQGSEEEEPFLELAFNCAHPFVDSTCEVERHEQDTTDCLSEDVAWSSTAENYPPCVKKVADLMALSRRRVRLKKRAERLAAKKARKLARAQAKQRRGVGMDLDSFLTRTRERLETRSAQVWLDILNSSSQAQRRGSSVDIETFQDVTRKRVGQYVAPKRLEVEDGTEEAKEVAKEKVNEFREKTKARIVERTWSKFPQVQNGLVPLTGCPHALASAFARRRIAVVGGGPVGLWVALLLELKYAAGVGRVRRPDAPEVTIVEARAKESHGTRTDIRIALSSSTQGLLNKRSRKPLFASGMSIAEIELALLDRLSKIAPQVALRFGHPVNNPSTLASSENFDCILWAGGRRSLDDELRNSLGCETRVGKSESVLVFQILELQGGGDIWKFAVVDFNGIVRQAALLPSLRVMIRPGQVGVSAGWLWLFGLPQEIDLDTSSGDRIATFQSMVDALDSLLKTTTSPVALGLRSAVEVLQQRVRPTRCVIKRVDASFWSSDRVACDIPSCPLVLLGDAAYGKPFYTGTTLNRHFWDAAALIDGMDWTHDGGVLANTCFDAYERRYQKEIRRIDNFDRQNQEPPPPQCALAHPPPPMSGQRLIPHFSMQQPPSPPKNSTLTTRRLPALDGMDTSPTNAADGRKST